MRILITIAVVVVVVILGGWLWHTMDSNTANGPAGTYATELTPEEDTQLSLRLTLQANNRATFITDYESGNTITENGTWRMDGDNRVAVTLTRNSNREYDNSKIMLFTQERNSLVAQEYNRSIYGENGFTLERVADTERASSAAAEASSGDFTYTCENSGRFVVSYRGENSDRAVLSVPNQDNSPYELENTQSGDVAEFENEDGSVVFVAEDGNGSVTIDGTTVFENCSEAGEIVNLIVAADRQPCDTNPSGQCLVVNGDLLAEPIEGFAYEPGYTYALRVLRSEEVSDTGTRSYRYQLLNVQQRRSINAATSSDEIRRSTTTELQG